MDAAHIRQIFETALGTTPDSIKRCTTGQGNYVYTVQYAKTLYIIRCTMERGCYTATIHWLSVLAKANIPVPRVIHTGRSGDYDYLILNYIEGVDLGDVYPRLSSEEKRKLAKQIVKIQATISALPLHPEAGWSWIQSINGILDRAKGRILQNGYFDVSKVEPLQEAIQAMSSYWETVPPIPFLDDISTKNLLIHNGALSGIIDIDEMGFGDVLVYVALTCMALLNEGYDTEYVEYIVAEMHLSEEKKQVLLLYTILFCVDFMGERGMCFLDKRIEVNPSIIDRLNGIYERLWEAWHHFMHI